MNKIIENIFDLDPELLLACDRLPMVFSPRIGIINALMRRHELEKYGLYMYQCLSSNVSKVFDLSREPSSGGMAVDTDETQALLGCFGEAIERYSVSIIDRSKLIYEFHCNLPKNKKIDNFDLYTEKQYKEHKEFINPYTTSMHWIEASNIHNIERKIYWPASLVYIPYDLEQSCAEMTSTGLACHPKVNKAISTGVLEIIERDAIMINVKKQLSPPHIDASSISHSQVPILEKVLRDYKVVLYQLFTDSACPVYLCYIWKDNRKDRFSFGIGASANPDSNLAVSKAIKEALFTYFYSDHLIHLKPLKLEEVTALYEHYLWYHDYDRFQSLLFKESQLIPYTQVKTDIEEIYNSVNQNGYEIFYTDLTSADIKRLGLNVIRTIIPGYVDLSRRYGIERENARRYNSVPESLNLSSCEGLSKLLHPMP